MLSALPLGFRFAEQPELLQQFPRGRISEIYGPRSSGRTGLVHAVLAASTERGECAALIDTTNAFDICSARLPVWLLEKLPEVRCCGTQPSRPCAQLTCCCKPADSEWWRWI